VLEALADGRSVSVSISKEAEADHGLERCQITAEAKIARMVRRRALPDLVTINTADVR
jgi:hypothetical protein